MMWKKSQLCYGLPSIFKAMNSLVSILMTNVDPLSFKFFVCCFSNSFFNLFIAVFWLDVCPSNGSLLALAGGIEKDVKFFDRRMRKVVRGINNIHEGRNMRSFVPRLELKYCLDYLNCVRWSPDSQTLATTSSDGSSKIVDFSTGKSFTQERLRQKVKFLKSYLFN